VRKLALYFKKTAQDISLTGTGATYSFTIPSTIVPETISRIFVRTGTDPNTDIEVISVRRNGSTLILPFMLETGQTLVIWYHTPYVIGTDDIPDYVAEVLYKLMEFNWIDYALKKRADFEQWAAIGRSDARIPELRQLKADIRDELKEIGSIVGSGLEIQDIWGGA
jgi:hypothetical protein